MEKIDQQESCESEQPIVMADQRESFENDIKMLEMFREKSKYSELFDWSGSRVVGAEKVQGTLDPFMRPVDASIFWIPLKDEKNGKFSGATKRIAFTKSFGYIGEYRDDW